MRLIDGDALQAEHIEAYGKRLLLIDTAPTIEQAEIIRCRDCKHHWTHRCMDSPPTEICEFGQIFYDADVDFCSLGERRG